MEAAILALVIGMLIAVAMAAGRLVTAEAAADHAARAAARIASLQRDPAAARTAASEAANDSLMADGLVCDSVTVLVDTSEFGRPIGAPASVRTTVRCAVRWSDLGLPAGSGTHAVTGDFLSPIDQLREQP
ncbi:hypothetical protein [Pseudonocardia sp. GCM10023141]|uniref:hypothetical protein n=1 Tax=Pseudonocardia sp. GCM10023141 TaxID=3252653 RepID=UPI0036177823